MASASSPLAETPNTAVRLAGGATPKRVRTQRRTSPDELLVRSEPVRVKAGRVLVQAEHLIGQAMGTDDHVGTTPAAARTPPHDEISWPSQANTTASGGSGGR